MFSGDDGATLTEVVATPTMVSLEAATQGNNY